MQIFLLLALLLISIMPAWADDCGFDAFRRHDFAAALKPPTECAEQGNVLAQQALAYMYHDGKGVPQNYKAEVRWYTLAATQGVAEAQANLGGGSWPLPNPDAPRQFQFNRGAGDDRVILIRQYVSLKYGAVSGAPPEFFLQTSRRLADSLRSPARRVRRVELSPAN